MKKLAVALALAGSLIAVQAHAASYDFSFSDTTLLTVSGLAPAISSPFYTFTIDTSTAASGGPAANTVFNNVSIFNGGTLVGTDSISFSSPASVSTDPGNGRLLNATGAYAFQFDPSPGTGNGKTITFATGTYAGDDGDRNFANATLSVAPSAVSAAPEPGTWALVLGGVGMLGMMLRRRRAGVISAA